MRLDWVDDMHEAWLVPLLLLLSTACGSGRETQASGGGRAATAASTGGGGGGGSGPATGGSGGGGFAPAAHAPFPNLPDQGGPKLDHVRMVSVNFTGTQFASELATFGDWIVGSDYYTAAGAEYGVFAGTHEQRLLDETPPASMSTSDAVSFLSARIASGALPPPDAETLYVFYLPPETLLTDIVGGCDMNNPYPSAFHDSGSYQGTTFSYAMVPICNSTTLAWTQTGAGHELFEAATDAAPLSDPAYQFPYGSSWQSLYGEVADLCESLPSAEVEGFNVPLLWSNDVAAKGDGWPCLPAPAAPYFGVTAPAPKLKVKAGVPKEIAMTAWSSAPLAAWKVAPFTLPVYLAPISFTPALDVTPKLVENGDAVTLLVKTPPGTPSGALGLAVVASQSAGGLVTMWPVLVEVE